VTVWFTQAEGESFGIGVRGGRSAILAAIYAADALRERGGGADTVKLVEEGWKEGARGRRKGSGGFAGIQ
jgi:hypothetical protein